MTADFRLILHATERDTNKLAAHSPGDGATEGGLADPGWSHQTKNRPLKSLLQTVHGQKLQNALLDLLEIVMVFVQGLLSFGDIQHIVGAESPRHIAQTFQIASRSTIFRRRGVDTPQTFQLPVGYRGHLFR